MTANVEEWILVRECRFSFHKLFDEYSQGCAESNKRLMNERIRFIIKSVSSSRYEEPPAGWAFCQHFHNTALLIFADWLFNDEYQCRSLVNL